MNDLGARCDVLERELADAKERIRQLEVELGAEEQLPLCFCLTPTEARILGVILLRPLARKDMIMAALYGSRGNADREPEEKIIHVLVCKMRPKLKPFGVEIETVWGQGWRMSAEMKMIVGQIKLREFE